jgi:hypothetical protein
MQAPSAAEAVGSPAAPVTEEQVRAALERVLAEPAFAEHEPSIYERLGAWLARLFEGFELPEGLEGGIGTALLVVLLVTLAVLAARFAARRTARRSERGAAEVAGERPVAERVALLRERAATAFREGDARLALRLYLFALVVGLGRRGDLEYRDAWTHRELLARGHPSPEVAAVLEPLVGELDRKLFGGGETTPADVERLAALCERFLGPAAAGASASGGPA